MELPSKKAIVTAFEAAVGRHDEPEIYGGTPGDPGLTGPGSMSWEIHSDVGAIAAAGMSAIIMEILHPSVMAGVYDQSSYRTQALRRARNTFGYVIITTFANTAAAERTINRVRRIHETINGTRPDGVEYRAMDPDLIGWVHTAIPWAIMQAFDRYTRPLSIDEKNRYLAEQAVIGRMGGAGEIPETVDDLHDFVEAMRPRLAVTQQTVEFIDFLAGETGGDDRATGLDRRNRRGSLHASMNLMPVWAQQMTGLRHSDLAQRLYFDPTTKMTGGLLRWAFGTPVYRQMAEERVNGIVGASVVRAA